MTEIVPAANLDSETLHDGANITLKHVARIEWSSRARPEYPFAVTE
jgi:hypothetical protein